MKVDILTPMDWLRQQLLVIEVAGRTCYQSGRDKEVTRESAQKFIRMILKRGHESVIEHSSMTVRFSGISRGFSHQVVRHRIASFSQSSTRYVDSQGFDIVLPPGRSLDDGGGYVREARDYMRDTYTTLREAGWKAEDARQFLPIGMANEIVVSANFRHWLHIMRMRTEKVAHWEIRRGMVTLLEMIREDLSPIFDSFALAGECGKGVPYYEEVG